METVNSWSAQVIGEQVWKDYICLAWETSPVLAVRMASRLRIAATEVIEKEIQQLVQQNPSVVAHIPEAIDYLVTRESITYKDLSGLEAPIFSWFVSPLLFYFKI